MSTTHWPSMRDLLGEELLASLLGIDLTSVRQYANEERVTPDEVAARLHWLAMVVAHLAGAYNRFGMRRWFERPRSKLNGKSPRQMLGATWAPTDAAALAVRECASSLSGAPPDRDPQSSSTSAGHLPSTRNVRGPLGRVAAHALDRCSIDARVIALFDNEALRSRVRKLEKVDLDSVWRLTLQALSRQDAMVVDPISAIEVHTRMLEGLAVETLLVSSAMLSTSSADAERFFGLSLKSIKARMGGTLDTAASERAMRAARATMTAAMVLGGYDAARAYMHTRNFALGGATPAELVATSEGERIVLDELHAQREDGPL